MLQSQKLITSGWEEGGETLEKETVGSCYQGLVYLELRKFPECVTFERTHLLGLEESFSPLSLTDGPMTEYWFEFLLNAALF